MQEPGRGPALPGRRRGLNHPGAATLADEVGHAGAATTSDPQPSASGPVRFGAAFVGWLLGGLAGPVAVTALLALVVNAMCGDANDCSWGFEYLLVVPVVLFCFFVMAPLMVGELVGKEAGIGARRRATRATALGALLTLVAVPVAAGAGGVGVVAGIVVLVAGVPALVTWRTRKRPPPAPRQPPPS